MIGSKWLLAPALTVAFGLAFGTPALAASAGHGKSKAKSAHGKAKSALVPVMSKEVTISKRKVVAGKMGSSTHGHKLVTNSKTTAHHKKHSKKKHA